ncbi:Secreted effector protein PipB [Legionella cherrii]|uniref:Secreted effector protein PipB n=1 Tax=Legionella cherrii TaxID=28084 RepID=A0A0W0S6N6_9GAMM|nr:pentapeptide repeat-containing protein [Legionella cherrii]KTC79094.1 Secreted effector protein PipB [Legionella cherrii]
MKDKYDQNQQGQMELIRAERARQFTEQKVKEEAKGLLEHLNSLNELFHRYIFPKDSHEDIYATREGTDKYVTAVLELQPVLNELIKKWDGIESDLRLLNHALQERLLATGKSSGLGDSLEHELAQFFKCLPVLQEHLNEVTSHINDQDEERRYHDQSIIVEVRLLQEHLQHILLQLSGEQLHDVDELTDSAVAATPSTALDAAEGVEDINQDNPLFALPDEMMMHILSHLPPQDLLNARRMAKSKTAVVDATLEMITRPHFIIDYLSHADGITGHQFTAFYQRTQRYQELKRKVLANEALTAEEAICYTLTRDCNVLPAHLKEAMHKLSLDEATRNHLELITTVSEEIRAIDAKYEVLHIYQYISDSKDDLTNLLARLKPHHPHQFVNVLAGANFSGFKFSGQDFSYLNLSGIRFKYADLRGVNFRGACLTGADLNKALLSGADFTNTDLRGAQLSRANFNGVDLSAMNLEGVDFEWAHIRGAQLLALGALNSPEELYAALAQFAQSIAKHSSGSKRKLQEQMLVEIAQQLESSTEHSIKEKIALLDVAIAAIKPDELIVGIFPFQNACQELKEKMTATEPRQDIPEHPLKQEAKEILERIFALLNVTDKGAAGAFAKNQTPREINEDAYSDEYRLLVGCIDKYPELDNSLKIAEALGISPEMSYMLYFTCPSIGFLSSYKPPILAGYHREKQQTNQGKKYASEVFDGHMFDIGALQKIKSDELDQYLYEEEDFAIFERNGRRKVKLGDLFITCFPPLAKDFVFSTVEVIDFETHKLKPAFSFDVRRHGGIPFGAFMPFWYNVGYTVPKWDFRTDDMQYLQEAYTFKKQVIERIFVSEKINRHRKKELFFPKFEQNNPVQVKTTVSTTSEQGNEKEKGTEKEVIGKENQHPKSTKLTASRGQGLFAAIQKERVGQPVHNETPSNPDPTRFPSRLKSMW